MALQYHHDRTDLRGKAVVSAVVGLALLLIILPVFHAHAAHTLWLTSLFVTLGAWALVVGIYGWLAHRARGRVEHISFDDTGFDSQLYGRVAFADILHHKLGRDAKLWRWEISAPSLKLMLADRRRVHFHLDSRYYTVDLMDYMGCIESIMAKIGANGHSKAPYPHRTAVFGDASSLSPLSDSPNRHTSNSPTPISPTPNSPTPNSPAPNSPETPVQEPPDTPNKEISTARRRSQRGESVRKMSAANRAAETRLSQQFLKHQKWYGIAIVLMTLTYLVRACGPEIKSTLSPDSLAGLERSAPQAPERSAQRLRTDIRQPGAMYLWGSTTAESSHHGMTEEAFERIVDTWKREFAERGVDVTAFDRRRYEKRVADE